MDVRLGWSGEIHGTWTKMDVEVDESDLNLLLAEKEIPLPGAMTGIEKFKLMYLIAEVFVQLHKMSRFPDVFGGDAGKKDLSELLATRDKILDAVKKRV